MTNSRYQSRLFNFFLNQSQRLGDSVGRTWRTCQVAASWSIETLLYPVFVLIQKVVNSADKQLKPQTAPQQKFLNSDTDKVKEQISTPECDVAIVKMLEMVKKIPSYPANSLNPAAEKLDYVKYHQQLEINDTAKYYLSTVQGIASHLINKHIVLVTVDNKVLDILTLRQQQRIQDIIIAEMVEYWRIQSLCGKQRQSSQNLLPEIDRLLYKLTAADTTPQQHNLEKYQATFTQLHTKSYISGLDAIVARVESSMLTVRRQTQEKLNMLLGEGKIVKISQDSNQRQPKHLSTEIATLIRLAVNHFFVKSTVIHQKSEVVVNRFKSTGNETLPKLGQSLDDNEDLWLTFDDLFGEELLHEEQGASKNPILRNSTGQKLLNESKADEQLGIQKISQMGESSYPLGMITHNSKKSAVPQQLESNILILNKTEGVKIKQRHQLPNLDEKPEFVEVTATSVGYEKHILERILEWLDNLMLWLEDKFVRILKLIQQIFT
jgi:hypothetical protein